MGDEAVPRGRVSSMEVIGTILICVGFTGALVGGIWFHFVAFRESLLWGLGCLCVPFVSLFFLALHAEKVGKCFFVVLVSIVLVVTGMSMIES